MRVKKAGMSSEAFTFELIRLCGTGMEPEEADDFIHTLKFKEISLVVPPSILDKILKAKKMYMTETEDEIIMTALDDWSTKQGVKLP